MSATGLMFEQKENELMRVQKQLRVYQQAVNKIDDYFEYRYVSVDDCEYVRAQLDALTKSLTQIK